MLATEPERGPLPLFVDLELSAAGANGRPIAASVRLVRGTQGKFSAPRQTARGRRSRHGPRPLSLDGGRRKDRAGGHEEPRRRTAICCSYVEPRHLMRLRMVGRHRRQHRPGPRDAPTMDHRRQTMRGRKAASGSAIRITAKDSTKLPGEIRLTFEDDGRTPAEAALRRGRRHRERSTSTAGRPTPLATDAMFEPPEGKTAPRGRATRPVPHVRGDAELRRRATRGRPATGGRSASRRRFRSSPATRPATACCAAARARRS